MDMRLYKGMLEALLQFCLDTVLQAQQLLLRHDHSCVCCKPSFGSTFNQCDTAQLLTSTNQRSNTTLKAIIFLPDQQRHLPLLPAGVQLAAAAPAACAARISPPACDVRGAAVRSSSHAAAAAAAE